MTAALGDAAPDDSGGAAPQFVIHLVPRRCASLRLRLWGYGQITLRSLAKTFSGAKGNWMELEG